ncbi:hypothetical protein FG05_01140 [Fusarium graminearum]|nr:hypothetical protein FG05_01140 [Fusarium graminearum]
MLASATRLNAKLTVAGGQDKHLHRPIVIDDTEFGSNKRWGNNTSRVCKDQQPVQEGTCLIGTLRVHRFMLKAKKSDNIRDFTMFDLARTRERTVTT